MKGNSPVYNVDVRAGFVIKLHDPSGAPHIIQSAPDTVDTKQIARDGAKELCLAAKHGVCVLFKGHNCDGKENGRRCRMHRKACRSARVSAVCSALAARQRPLRRRSPFTGISDTANPTAIGGLF